MAHDKKFVAGSGFEVVLVDLSVFVMVGIATEDREATQ